MHYGHVIKVPATLIGFSALGVEMANNAESLQGAGIITVAGVLVVTLAGAMAPVFAEHLWAKGHKLIAIPLTLIFLLVAAVTLTTALERTSGSLDAKISAHETGAGNRALAEQNLKDAEQGKKNAERIQKRECVKDGSTSCKRAERKLAKAVSALAETRRALAAAEDTASKAVDDGGNKRLAKVLGVSEDAVRQWQPWLIPVAIPLCACVFLAVGLSPAWGARPGGSPEVKPDPVAATPDPHVILMPNPITALQRLALELERCGRQTRKSGNKLAGELGYSTSTFGAWLKRWEDRGDIVREDGWIKLPPKRKRRA